MFLFFNASLSLSPQLFLLIIVRNFSPSRRFGETCSSRVHCRAYSRIHETVSSFLSVIFAPAPRLLFKYVFTLSVIFSRRGTSNGNNVTAVTRIPIHVRSDHVSDADFRYLFISRHYRYETSWRDFPIQFLQFKLHFEETVTYTHTYSKSLHSAILP